MKMQLEAKQLLVFNSRRLLILVCNSVNQASKFAGVSPGNISRCCQGDLISYKNFYYRYLKDNIVLDMSDIGQLTLEEYDGVCKEKREIHTTRQMNHRKSKQRRRISISGNKNYERRDID